MDDSIPTMLPIKEVSKNTGIGYGFIRQLCLNHRIIHIRNGSKFLINYEKFIDYLNSNTEITKGSEENEDKENHEGTDFVNT